jgi:hypothetical protein
VSARTTSPGSSRPRSPRRRSPPVQALRGAGVAVVVAPAPDLSCVPGVPAALRPALRTACAELQRRQAGTLVRVAPRAACTRGPAAAIHTALANSSESAGRHIGQDDSGVRAQPGSAQQLRLGCLGQQCLVAQPVGPRTMTRAVISAFARADRPRGHRPHAAQHDLPL